NDVASRPWGSRWEAGRPPTCIPAPEAQFLFPSHTELTVRLHPGRSDLHRRVYPAPRQLVLSGCCEGPSAGRWKGGSRCMLPFPYRGGGGGGKSSSRFFRLIRLCWNMFFK